MICNLDITKKESRPERQQNHGPVFNEAVSLKRLHYESEMFVITLHNLICCPHIAFWSTSFWNFTAGNVF